MKFPKLVIEEAKALKKHATKEERDKLSFIQLDPSHAKKCIYGQMTGDCFNSRSVELIEKCARRVYNNHSLIGLSRMTRRNLNGSPKERNRLNYWSPIEVLIAKFDKKINARLIQFLKGEIKSLNH